MRRTLIITSVLLFLCIDAGRLFACGDKFLLVGRGARYQRGYVSLHPGTLLLFANTPATSSRGLRAALKMAGHRVTVVESRTDLDAALRTTRYDLLLADSSETAQLIRDFPNSPTRPTIVPVLASGLARPAAAASGKEFCVVRMDNRQRHALAVLDDILGAKLKGTTSQCEPAR